ncbi:MAG: tetratricopeptide repeat protein [Dehalococcoidia bacterium]|nr:MAG: tetratricopeptide repeat protein [Dehalococcoidia bacterium]
MLQNTTRTRFRAGVAVLATVGLALIAACGGETGPPPEDTVTTAALSETPADLTAAREYERNGQYEEAVAAYQRVIQQFDGQAQQQARYDLALTYITIERYADAVTQLEAYIDTKPTQEESLRARFLLGQTYATLGEGDKARQSLEDYADDEGPAAVYARLELAQLLVQEGRHDKAAQELEKALALDVPPSLAPTLFLRLADIYRETGDDEQAIQWYERLLQESNSDTYKALALSRIASVSRRLGDGERWQQALLDIVEQHPESPQAPNSLDSLLAAEVPVDLLTQGIVHYHQRAYDEALAVFDSFLAGNPPAPQAAVAHYYRGAMRERQDEPQEALADYEAYLQFDPGGDVADDAAWARALLLEELFRPLEAAAAHREFWQAHPDSPWADRAAFLSGLFPYQAGDPTAASAAWQEMLDASTSPERRAQAYLWLGQADLVFFADTEGASAHFQQALEAAGSSFYALRAEAWLSDQAAAALPLGPDETIEATAAPDWDAAEGWLSSLWGPDTLAADPSPLDLPAWQRGQELHQMGLTQKATNEFLWLIDQSRSQPWSLYRLARALHDLGLTHVAAHAATDLLESADSPLEQAPRALLELAYPLDYLPLIDAAAAENSLSPLLLLAMIRQESFFDPTAGSPAGALGLTQVMPLTGSEIAQKLSIEDFSASDLLRPLVSIPFGAYYLGSQLDLFDGNLFLALAAYNAGPGNASRWWESLPAAEMDLLVELIDITETRTYVKVVLENYAMYRFLYGSVDHPTLLASPGP